jgi:hypothetical protein
MDVYDLLFSTARSRKRQRCPSDACCSKPHKVFANDTLRIQHKVDRLKSFVVHDMHNLSGPAMKKGLALLGVDVAHENDKEHLRALYRQHVLDKKCTVCMEDPVTGDAIVITACGHSFHHSCLHTAAQESFEQTKNIPSCPMCRASLF